MVWYVFAILFIQKSYILLKSHVAQKSYTSIAPVYLSFLKFYLWSMVYYGVYNAYAIHIHKSTMLRLTPRFSPPFFSVCLVR